MITLGYTCLCATAGRSAGEPAQPPTGCVALNSYMAPVIGPLASDLLGVAGLKHYDVEIPADRLINHMRRLLL